MGFGGQMHDPIRLKIGEGRPHGGCIADVGLKELVVRISLKIRQGSRVASVGEFVDVEDLVALGDKEMNKVGADESGPAGDEDFHVYSNRTMIRVGPQKKAK
jgi:hypothetical protein